MTSSRIWKPRFLRRYISYRCLEPFSDVFGVTSRLVLTQQPTLDELAALPVADLAAQLYELSGHHLPDPRSNAHKLQRVAQESFRLAENLAVPVQRILDLTLAHIEFLEAQVQQVEAWIATEVVAYPVITQLATIPGVGPVFSSGLGAEIGPIERFLQAPKWDRKRKRYRARNLRDAEDAVAKPVLSLSKGSPACGGPAPIRGTLPPKTGGWPRPAIATCATTSSRPRT